MSHRIATCNRRRRRRACYSPGLYVAWFKRLTPKQPYGSPWPAVPMPQVRESVQAAISAMSQD